MNNTSLNINTILSVPNNQDNNLIELHTQQNNEYENNLFFNNNKSQSYKLASILGETATVTKIDAKYLTSMATFITYTKNTDFSHILEDFLANIIEFVSLTNLYLEEDYIKEDFNRDIGTLITKITAKKNYFALGSGIINLFTITRPNLATIVQAMKKLNQYHNNPKLELQDVKDFYNHCNISYDSLKNLLYNSVTDLNACLNGVNSRFLILYNTIEASFTGKLGLLANKKNELSNNFIQELEIDFINRSQLKYIPSTSIHYHIALKNTIADKYGLQHIKDDYTDIIELSDYHQSQVYDTAKFELLPVNITKSLADDLIEKFKILLVAHDCLQWLEQSLAVEYFVNNNIFVELDENFFQMCNALYTPVQNDIYLEEFQQNKLSFYDIIEIEYKNNTELYSIKDIDSKLHAWIVSSYLPADKHKLLIDISTQELITDEPNLAIAAMGSCYFWVVNKNSIKNKKIFDFNNHTPIQLSHIPFDIYNKLEIKLCTSLIIQSLRQTNNAQEIVNFFNRNHIYDNVISKHINKIISKKISNNTNLKQNLINIICKDVNYICSIGNKKSFNLQKAYWFIDSKLLEPILKQLDSNNIDISDVINNLTITQLLTFKDKLSLKNFYISIIKKHNDNAIDYDHFCRFFVNLSRYSGKAAKYLLYSGLIDNILNYSSSQGDTVLMKIIRDKDIDAINMLIDINSKLDEVKKIEINSRNKDGKTALMLAVETGSNDFIDAIFKLNDTISLEDNKIDFNIQDNNGFTALMHTLDCNNYTVIIKLFCKASEEKALLDYDIKNNDGYTALMLAVCSEKAGKNNRFNILMSLCYPFSLSKHYRTLNISTKNFSNQTALTLILKIGNFSILKSFLEQIKKYFYNHLEYINIEPFKDDIVNSLSYALTNNYNEEICCQLITLVNNIFKMNINFDLTKESGDTVLMNAMIYHKNIFIKYLLNSCNHTSNSNILDINKKNTKNETALSLSVSFGNANGLKILLDHCNNLNINIKSEDIEAALKSASGAEGFSISHLVLLNNFKNNN